MLGMSFVHLNSCNLSMKIQNLGCFCALITLIVSEVLASIQPAQDEQPCSKFCLRCEICGGRSVILQKHAENKYDNLFQVENHLYLSINITEIEFHPGYKHLRCSVAEIYLCNQMICLLRDQKHLCAKNLDFDNYEELETLKQSLNTKLKIGLDHLFNLLIYLYKKENLPNSYVNEIVGISIRECFTRTEQLSFELTLNYLFLSMGDLRINIKNRLLNCPFSWFVKYKSQMRFYFARAFEAVKTHEIAQSSTFGLGQLFEMHDTFFLPLLFNSTKLVDIYASEMLIEFIEEGSCFLENRELRELAVFRHIFLACLINDIKVHNKEICELPLKFVNLCKKISQAINLESHNQGSHLEEFLNQLDSFEQHAINQHYTAVNFCFNGAVLFSRLQTVKNDLIGLKHGNKTKVEVLRHASLPIYMYESSYIRAAIFNHCTFYNLVSFIWKYVNFNYRRGITCRSCTEYFDTYAFDDGKQAYEWKSHHWTRINYILLNHIFGLDCEIFSLELIKASSKYNMEGQVYSIYMVTNHAVIISFLKKVTFKRFYNYILEASASGTTLPMFSENTTPITIQTNQLASPLKLINS